MKRISAFLLILLMLSGLLTACGKDNGKATSVTKEEQLERTGIDLQVMEYCESVEYFVLTGKNGAEIPQITFSLDGVPYCYRAEFTKEILPYNFSPIDGVWNWTGNESVGTSYKVQTRSAGGINGAWSAWIRNGIAYVLSSSLEESGIDSVVSDLIFPELWIAGDSGSAPETMNVPADYLADFIWKYDDGEEYLRITGNRIYELCGEDKTPDGKVRFWRKSDDSTIELLDENGTVMRTLYAAGTYEFPIVTDDTGRSLSRFDGVLNGNYYCQITSDFYDGGMLYLVQKLPFWISDAEADALDVGSVINATFHDFLAAEVTGVMRLSDTKMTVTAENDTVYRLSRDNSAGAWIVTGGEDYWVFAGQCMVTADTAYIGSICTDLGSCLAAHRRMYATVSVDNGVATAIETYGTSDS